MHLNATPIAVWFRLHIYTVEKETGNARVCVCVFVCNICAYVGRGANKIEWNRSNGASSAG